jgi:hypothetical protein
MNRPIYEQPLIFVTSFTKQTHRSDELFLDRDIVECGAAGHRFRRPLKALCMSSTKSTVASSKKS